ncbi:hypothetical protein CFP56_026194 [Quercus suber]|uniref:Uncharacterized protein n=1 Tax=Quercus suber TaxID=58331 RepID=A0AAW0K2T9_QUESU
MVGGVHHVLHPLGHGVARNGRSREEIDEEELIGFIKFRCHRRYGCHRHCHVQVYCNGLRRVVVMVGGVHHVLHPLGHVGLILGASLCCCLLGGRIEF